MDAAAVSSGSAFVAVVVRRSERPPIAVRIGRWVLEESGLKAYFSRH